MVEVVKDRLLDLKKSNADLDAYDTIVQQVLNRSVTHLTNEPFYVEIDEYLSQYVKPQQLKFFKTDLNLVWVYLFGLIPSMIAWSKGMLLAESFWVTSIQYFIVLWIFLLIKSLPFTIRNIYHCMDLFCFGVVINSIYMLYLFGFADMGRQSGWMDNPNFAALAGRLRARPPRRAAFG